MKFNFVQRMIRNFSHTRTRRTDDNFLDFHLVVILQCFKPTIFFRRLDYSQTQFFSGFCNRNTFTPRQSVCHTTMMLLTGRINYMILGICLPQMRKTSCFINPTIMAVSRIRKRNNIFNIFSFKTL